DAVAGAGAPEEEDSMANRRFRIAALAIPTIAVLSKGEKETTMRIRVLCVLSALAARLPLGSAVRAAPTARPAQLRRRGPRMPRGLRGALIVSLVAIIALLALSPSQASEPTFAPTIAIVSTRDYPAATTPAQLIPASEIYLMNPDGTDARRL